MKKALQKIVFAFCALLISPLVILYKLFKSKNLFSGQGQLLALVPGKLGSYLRVAYYTKTLQKCSSQGYIGFGSFIAHPETELGYGYYIGAYCIIGTARIMDHVTIASHVSILSGKNQHGFKEIGIPIQNQPGVFTKITIGENCWLGSGAIVMADLGTQNIIAAGSVVVNKTEDYVVLGGNPARVIQKLELAGRSDSKTI